MTWLIFTCSLTNIARRNCQTTAEGLLKPQRQALFKKGGDTVPWKGVQEVSTTGHGQRLSSRIFPGVLDIPARDELVQRKGLPGFGTHSRRCFPAESKSMVDSQALKQSNSADHLRLWGAQLSTIWGIYHCTHPEEKTSDILLRPHLPWSKQKSLISFPILKSFITREQYGKSQWFPK